MFFRKNERVISSSEVKLNTIIELIKDLPKADYNRLKKGMNLIYQGYQEIRNAKTPDEKEYGDIEESEIILNKEINKWAVDLNY